MTFDPYAAIRQLFCRVFCPCKSPRVVARITLRFGGFSVTFNATGGFMITIPDDQPTTTLSLAFVDSKGKPSKVDGAPVWTPPDASFGSLAVAADGMTAVFTLPDPPILGAFQIRADADADMGSGVEDIIVLGDFDVVAGKTVAGTMSAAPGP